MKIKQLFTSTLTCISIMHGAKISQKKKINFTVILPVFIHFYGKKLQDEMKGVKLDFFVFLFFCVCFVFVFVFVFLFLFLYCFVVFRLLQRCSPFNAGISRDLFN